MIDTLTLFFIYAGFVLAILVVAIFFIVKKILLDKGLISHSLNLALLAVRFAPDREAKEVSLEQIREKIALMEQLYSHFSVIKSKPINSFFYGKLHLALELAVPDVGEELTFYIAIPRKSLSAVEKIIQGIYPEAYLEESKDYNIFNPGGVGKGAAVFLKENKFYPIKTYKKIEGDSLKPLVNVFTKLAKKGEGASVQIVFRMAHSKWRSKLKETARKIWEGKHNEGKLEKFMAGAEEIFSGVKSPADEKKKTVLPSEEELAKEMETKAGKNLFEANIRILTSAANEVRAGEILSEISLAFEEFQNPISNYFGVKTLIGGQYQKLVYDYSFRNFDDKTMSVLSTEELTSIFHFPNVPLEAHRISKLKAKEAPSPVNIPSSGLLLGYNSFRQEKRDIFMLDEDRRRHMYIIGQTGTGKSVFMENMIVQDIANGKGVGVIDPHGELIEHILGSIPTSRLEDVIYFNPGDTERPMGLNMLEYDDNFPEQKTFIVNELFGIFQKLYGGVPESMGPIFEQYFRNATMLVMDDPESGNTMLEISRVMSDKNFRDLKISRAKNVVVKNFWTQIAEKAGGESELRNIVPYITSKFDVFLSNEIMRPIIAQEKSSFNFRQVMDNKKILLVNLSKGRLGDINSALIGLIVVGRLSMAALSRTDILEENRNDFYLYIDEFQNVTTDSIATILSEARKYRLDLTITHQFIAQLKEEIKKSVFGNVGTIVSFRIGSDDAEFISKLYEPIFKTSDLLQLDNFNSYVKLLVSGQTTDPFSLKTYSPLKINVQSSTVIKELSRLKYGRSKSDIENEIEMRSTM